jgi:N-formylglutamate deformylase
MGLFELKLPTCSPVPIVANLPHSGTFIPALIEAQMSPGHARSIPNTDWHLNQLYDFLPALGVTVLQATHSRYVVDLNRSLRPPLLGSFYSSVIPAQTAFGHEVYVTPPSDAQIQARI